MSDITQLYQEWQRFEAEAQVGSRPLHEAKGAKGRFTDIAREYKATLPFKTDVAVRVVASPRVDIAEHLVAKGDVESGSFVRADGQAFCNRNLTTEGELVVINRRSPSCLRCLLIAEAILGGATTDDPEDVVE